MPVEGSTRRAQPIGAATSGVLVRELRGRVAQDQRHDEKLVVVELSGPSSGSQLRQLGSLVERHGMRMHLVQAIPTHDGRARASITVPRAKTQREAEQVIATFLDWIPRPADEAMRFEASSARPSPPKRLFLEPTPSAT